MSRSRPVGSAKILACGLTLFLLVLSGRLALSRYQAGASEQIWEPAIRNFERQDKANPPKPGGIVFTGSSSIRYWDTLVDDMKPLEVINRGFGGSQLDDVDRYAKRIVIPYHPMAVVLYAGDNDLAAGSPKTPETVLHDFQQFVHIVHEALPQTWIYYISIKPSTLRWAEWPRMRAANQMIAQYARSQQRVQFIDIAPAMLKPDGSPRAELLKADGLHPTAQCYALWTAIIKPVLMQRFGPMAAHASLPSGRVTGRGEAAYN